MKTSQETWLSRKYQTLTKTGKLSLIGEKKIDLSVFSQPSIQKDTKIIKVLDLSRTDIKSLEGLPYLPRLKTFIADKTEIDTFKNFSSIKNVISISLKETEISKKLSSNKYRLSLILVCPQLSTIDNKMIPQQIRDIAATYPPVCSQLINAGWMIETPPPTGDHLEQLCKQYIKDETEPLKTSSEVENSSKDFQEMIKQLHNKHEQVILNGLAKFGIISEETEDMELANRVKGVLSKHNIETGNNSEAILEAIRKLATQHSQHMSQHTETEVSDLE